MARGAQKTAENLAQSGYNSSQQYNTNLTNQNQQIQGYLLPQFQNLIQNPGYDQTTKNAITNASEGAVGATYASANDALARRAARTKNSAGEMAGTAANNQIQFANRAKADVTQGLEGISGLYGMDTNLLSRSLGIPAEYLGLYNNAANIKGNGVLGNLIGAYGQVGSAALGAL